MRANVSGEAAMNTLHKHPPGARVESAVFVIGGLGSNADDAFLFSIISMDGQGKTTLFP